MLFGDEHVRRYEETDGEVGHDWQKGAPVLILTTKGRKTGQDRKFALIYQEHEGAYAVVASNGGADQHPGWFRNLQENPEVQVQVKADKFTARARTADEQEKAVLWPKMAAVWPDYDDYQKKTDRPIPVVVLERQS
ncbi:nitroreductase family deazaflavin-dependent oxidoreductase [Saccharothrix sp. AJ9571]|nr:nitroreductase family deazaflavin-dependent oxidoreductase [Saccharothrix sp. AJ9571]